MELPLMAGRSRGRKAVLKNVHAGRLYTHFGAVVELSSRLPSKHQVGNGEHVVVGQAGRVDQVVSML